MVYINRFKHSRNWRCRQSLFNFFTVVERLPKYEPRNDEPKNSNFIKSNLNLVHDMTIEFYMISQN